MVDEEADRSDRGEDEVLDAPERREADELMDHGAAGDELGPMRHSAAHVLAEAVLDLFPGTKLGIGPVIADGFYYDFLLPAPADARRPAGHRGAHARVDRRRPPVRVQRGDPRGGPRRPRRGATSRSRSRSSTTCSRPPKRDGTPMPPTTFYRQGPFIDLCRGPHVASTGKIGPFKLLGTAGAYWRGDEKRPMLQRVYGTAWATQEELDLYLERRAEAKKRDHRRLGVALDLYSFHDVSPGSAFWHPKGQRIWRTLETRDARAPGAARLPGGLDADPRLGEAVAPVRPLGPLRREHVHRRVREAALQPQADELPGVDVHLPLEAAVVPRPAAPLQRVRPAAPQRALRRAERPDPGPPVHPGRRPHLRPTRPARRRARGAARRGPRGVLVGRPRAAVRVRDEAGQGDRRSRRCGSAPRA